ncbi:MAG: acetate/propionate family kinase [Castellaniella sp.]
MSDEICLILVLNCGSSSIKYAIYEACGTEVPREALLVGKVEGIGEGAACHSAPGEDLQTLTLDSDAPYLGALAVIRDRVRGFLEERRLDAVVHRVVHGGTKYSAPVHIDRAVLEDLRGYIPLAPLHQPFALQAMDALLASEPDLPQFACFDTAFHRTLPRVEQILPLPWDAWKKGLQRYGFHGLSYEYIATVLRERYGEQAHGRVIVGHIGNGASLCGMKNLESVATTMGFSTLDGLMMGTRCGALDPGAILYLMEVDRLPLEQVGQMLNRESGLLGVSGLSCDMRVLLEHEQTNDQVRIALELYVRSMVREIGAMTALLGGLDMLVFTAGVGEHSGALRARVCKALAYLGVALDDAANAADAAVISAGHSRVRVLVEPTNEEWMAAVHANRLHRQIALG